MFEHSIFTEKNQRSFSTFGVYPLDSTHLVSVMKVITHTKYVTSTVSENSTFHVYIISMHKNKFLFLKSSTLEHTLAKRIR